jgi:hypothetical protein
VDAGRRAGLEAVVVTIGEVWRQQPRLLLAVYVVLEWLLLLFTRTVGADLNEGMPVAPQVFWSVVVTGLAWLVWRRSQVAWALLLVLGILPLLMMILGADGVTAYMSALVLRGASQLVVLLSPAVRRHIRRPAKTPAASRLS